MADEVSHSPFSVLFVEDDALVCTTIGRMIAREFPDATVYTAENGLIGLELFKKHLPGIVITDINLPAMDGFEMAGIIKSVQSDTKIIVLTGYSDKSHYDRFNEIGFFEYFVKPVDFIKLFAAIKKCRTECPLQN